MTGGARPAGSCVGRDHHRTGQAMWDMTWALGHPDDSTRWPNLTLELEARSYTFAPTLDAKNRGQFLFSWMDLTGKGIVLERASPTRLRFDVVLPTAGQPSASASAVKRPASRSGPWGLQHHTISAGTASSRRWRVFRCFPSQDTVDASKFWVQSCPWPARAAPIDRSRGQERPTRDQRLSLEPPDKRGIPSWLSP